ncbi:zincin [Coemansia reversa NRRL 1564]|uniref:Zincin n=1 Tax=Coemansia reversa (strain ATCC 12441 / NRRL 1564) TaxID=763665 RepID=A0A2G5BIR1_COERN|nr:zincin [Coemansia reversa NRRL 1564]|eukprot:PIA18895.1 zincin [Coemansia reversa NRRL 1564]
MLSEVNIEENAIRFDLSPEEIICTAKYAVTRERQFLDAIAQVEKPTFKSVIVPLKEADSRYNTEYRIGGFLQYVSVDKNVRDASAEAMALAYSCKVEYLKREDVYKVVRVVYDNDKEMADLSVEDRTLVEKTELMFRRTGLLLSEDKRKRLAELETRLSELTYLFTCNIRDMEKQVYFTREELEGLPESYFCCFETKHDNDMLKYIVTTTSCDYLPVMEYARNENTRKILYATKESRCPENISILEEAVQIRSEKACLLGYNTFSEYMLETRSASTPEVALGMLEELREELTVLAKKELNEIETLKRLDMEASKLPYKGVFEWDIEYYARKAAATKNEIKRNFCEYFEINTMLPRVLSFFEKLFGVSIFYMNNPNVWSPNVIALEVWKSDKKVFIGNLYLDLYARDGKLNQTSLFSLCHGHHRRDGSRENSAMALVVNFPKSSALKPTLLEHSDVCILMGMLGQALYNTCSVSKWSELFIDFRGTFSEAIAQMTEQFAWEPSVLRQIATHYRSGKSIPDNILNAIVANKNVGSGLNNLRQLFYGIYDLSIHNPTKDVVDIQNLYNSMAKDIAMINNGDVVTLGAATFSHLISDYESTYFEYLQATIYGADMFLTYTLRHDTDDIRSRTDFGCNILQSVYDPDKTNNIISFLGRNPNNKAFFELLK